jgi:hypothetical protein
MQLGVLCRPETKDLLALEMTCKAARLSTQQVIHSFNSINKQLKPWFYGPLQCRSLQAQCSILIGGTFAHWSFARRSMPDNTDLWIYFHNLVFRTHATADFHLISWNKAYSVYSYTTLVKRKHYPLSYGPELDTFMDWSGQDQGLETMRFEGR